MTDEKLYDDVMIDIETMGRDPDAAIIEIGAVAIDLPTKTLGPEFAMRIPLESAVRAGGRMDADTVLWWTQQDEAARRRLADNGAVAIDGALGCFATWLAEHCTDQVKAWGNGANFDNVILAGAYRRLGCNVPWHWWNDRCYRTVARLHPHVALVRTGTKHSALDDALTQARHLIAMLTGDGVAAIAAERRRHVEVEGWTPEHDAAHQPGMLERAASCYAMQAALQGEGCPQLFSERVPTPWPWSDAWWKPAERLRNLEKAGALIAAAIDGLKRGESKVEEH